MLGRQERGQDVLFVAGSMKDLIPDEHILKKIDAVLDLSWLRAEVEDLYCGHNGRPGIDPEAAVRLMLAGLSQGITADRALMREAQVNLAIRWFAGYRLDERLPDHSSLTRIRQRWGPQRFERIFQRSVAACIDGGLVGGDVLHVDATLIRADVSWESLVCQRVEEVWQANQDDDPDGPGGTSRKPGRPKSAKAKMRTVSRTDPEATMSTSCKQYRMEPCYKQHTAVDDRTGVVVDVQLTTGQVNEGKQLIEQIERVEQATGRKVETVTADSGYAHGSNYRDLENRGTAAVIPPQRAPKRRRGSRPGRLGIERFGYDAKHDIVRCPRKKILRPCKTQTTGTPYRARRSDCRDCPLADRCLGTNQKARVILLCHGYESLLRARRAHARRGPDRKRQYDRHRGLVEGRHGEAKSNHGLSRAARRGLSNVAIQVFLTAAVMNFKRLAALCAQIGWPLDLLLTEYASPGPYGMAQYPKRALPHTNIPRAA